MNPTVLDQPFGYLRRPPALRSFADECSAVLVRIMAYLCGLTVLAMIAVDLFSAVPSVANAGTPTLPPGCQPAGRIRHLLSASWIWLAEQMLTKS